MDIEGIYGLIGGFIIILLALLATIFSEKNKKK